MNISRIKHNILFYILLFCICLFSASYANELPFVGKVDYSPSGGNGYVEVFEITHDGNLKITGYGITGSGLIYEGKYKPLILSKDLITEYGHGYLFENNRIYILDELGNKIKINSDDCYSAFLYPDDDEYCSRSTSTKYITN